MLPAKEQHGFEGTSVVPNYLIANVVAQPEPLSDRSQMTHHVLTVAIIATDL